MRHAAVLGHPVEHSLSPVLHSAAYRALGLNDWDYGRHDIDAAGLSSFLSGLDPSWVGLSLTMPLKRAVLGLVDHVEPLADVVGAANTVLIDSNGRPAVAANTDVYGIVTALREAGVRRPIRGAVLGAGATAASALAGLAELGVQAPVVFARSIAKAGHLVPMGHRMSLDVVLRRWPNAKQLREFDVVVSTVPDGTTDVERELEEITGVLLDVRYDIRPTPMVKAWLEAGGQAVGGETMLLHQACEQVRLMTGRPAPIAEMTAALNEALAP